MKWLVLLGLTLCFLPHPSNAASSAGFVEGIWYSTTTPMANVPLRIYVAVRNNSGSDITGTITFYDNGHSISHTAVAAVDGHIIESWADWTPTTGEHTISAKLTNVEVHTIGQSPKPTIIANANATSTIAVKPPPPPPKPKAPATSKTNKNSGTTTASTGTSTPKGFEQFLKPSRVASALGGITTLAENAKQAIDAYRAPQKPVATTGTTALDIPVDSSGFGAVTRTSAQGPKKPTAQKPTGTVGDIFSVVGTVIGGVFSGILAALSWLLGNPMLVQFSLLILLLLLPWLIARRLAKRRFKK